MHFKCETAKLVQIYICHNSDTGAARIFSL
jgi:hypothetical protein